MDINVIKRLKSASRSVLISITNNTTETLFRTCYQLKSGRWVVFPPNLIDPNQTVSFCAESYGFMSGTSGEIQFQMWEGQIPIIFQWDSAFFGSSYAKSSCGDGFSIDKTEKIGNLVEAHFIIEDPYRETRQESKIRKPPLVLEQWIVDLQKAQQSILMRIHNLSQFPLYLTGAAIHHGVWRQIPPDIIEPDSVECFGAESHGLRGTEGEIRYQVTASENPEVKYFMPLFWKIPLISEAMIDYKIFDGEVQCKDGNHFIVDLKFTMDDINADQQKKMEPYNENRGDEILIPKTEIDKHVDNNDEHVDNNDEHIVEKKEYPEEYDKNEERDQQQDIHDLQDPKPNSPLSHDDEMGDVQKEIPKEAPHDVLE